MVTALNPKSEAADEAAIRAHLERVYGASIAPGAYLVVWTADAKEPPVFCMSLTGAVNALKAASNRGRNVYIGVCLQREKPLSGRGDAAGVVIVPALWLDLDIANPLAHKPGKTYPPDIEAARGLLASLPAQPTLLIDSGHGLHGWWLFSEPYEIESEEERDYVARVSQGWQARIRQAAKARGWDVDATHDLARVLRAPGTWNRKAGCPAVMAVTLIDDGPVYSGPQEFEQWIELPAPAQRATSDGEETAGSTFVINPAAQVPHDKWEALCENSPKFKRTWDRKRGPDLKDQSASGYEMSLVSFCVDAGWTDQEIVDTCLAWRRKHGQVNPQKHRPAYFEQMIAKGRADTQWAQQINELSVAPMTEEDSREARVATISNILGVPVERLIQHGKQNARYTLVLEGGIEVPIGSVDALVEQSRFRKRLVTDAQVVMQRIKPEQWDDVVRALLSITEFIDMPSAERRTQTTEWVRSYISAYPPATEREEVIQARYERQPYVKDGLLYIFENNLRRYVIRQEYEKSEIPDLCDALRACGFEQKTVSGRHKETGKVFSRSYFFARLAAIEGDHGEPDDDVSDDI